MHANDNAGVTTVIRRKRRPSHFSVSDLVKKWTLRFDEFRCDSGVATDDSDFKFLMKLENAIPRTRSQDFKELLTKLRWGATISAAGAESDGQLEDVIRSAVEDIERLTDGPTPTAAKQASPTHVQTLWAQWLAENDSAAALDERQQYATPMHRAEYATGAELGAAEPTCLGDCLIQLRRAELIEDWPAVARAIEDIARLACVEAVPNPWDAALAA